MPNRYTYTQGRPRQTATHPPIQQNTRPPNLGSARRNNRPLAGVGALYTLYRNNDLLAIHHRTYGNDSRDIQSLVGVGP